MPQRWRSSVWKVEREDGLPDGGLLSAALFFDGGGGLEQLHFLADLAELGVEVAEDGGEGFDAGDGG